MRSAIPGALCAVVLWSALCMPFPAAAQLPEPAAPPPAADEPIEVTDLLAQERATAPGAFDPEAATEAYLARLSPAERARSDAYFEGGYWILLWSFLWGLGVAWLLLATRLSARMRSLAERITRFRFLQAVIYGLQYVLAASLLGLPWAIYTNFFREHQYEMATQTFGAWLGDQGKELLIGLIFGPLMIAAVYAVIRKAPRTWWIWVSAVLVAFMIVGILLAPVFIEPLFNKYTPLEEGTLRERILSLARANGIPADEVYVVDASRQTKRISANVAGLGGTMRVALNDNLLNRTSPAEIESVMGHEMGHYALNHVYEMIIEFGLLIVVGAAFVAWASQKTIARRGVRWEIRDVGDLAGLPLLLALFSVYMFVMTPIVNTIIRVNEVEADIYGLNAARQPDGFAEVALKLGEYRKLSPGPIEEWIFFDHPSGRNRIRMAMEWKAEHQGELADASR